MGQPLAAHDPVIEFRDLSKAFRGHLGIGRTVAVDGLDLQVERGEVFGLLGPNGAGKTTTLKLMLGLLRPDRGSVSLLGARPADPEACARIGYLPENPYFYDYLTVEEFLDFYGRLQGLSADARRRTIGEVVRRVGLEGRQKTALRKFSKGMIQRVGLAQAIQHDPDLVILDEPMSGLDPIGRRDVRDLILSLKETGKTVFFSSHILQDVEMICDRVAILKQGKLRSAGSLGEMITSRVRWFEVAIRGEMPGPLPGEELARSGQDALIRVPDVPALTRLLTAAEQNEAQVQSVWPRRETLEDLFLRKVRDESEGS